MNIKRTIVSTLAALALTATACGGNDNSTSSNSAALDAVAASAGVSNPTEFDLDEVIDRLGARPSQADIDEMVDGGVLPEAGEDWATLVRLQEVSMNITDPADGLDAAAAMFLIFESLDRFNEGGASSSTTYNFGDTAEWQRFGLDEITLDAMLRDHSVLGPLYVQWVDAGGWEHGDIEFVDGVAVGPANDDLDWEPAEETAAGDDDNDDDDLFSFDLIEDGKDQVFTGPWHDHALGRCEGFERHTDLVGGGYSNDTFAAQPWGLVNADFDNEQLAEEAFDQIDTCYVENAVNRFLNELRMDGEVSGAGFQVHEVRGTQQIQIFEYTDQGVPVVVTAIQDGSSIGIALTHGQDVDATFALLEGWGF